MQVNNHLQVKYDPNEVGNELSTEFLVSQTNMDMVYVV